MNYYIYRFKNKLDEIIYIGKTVNINTRMKKHFSRGHLSYECYDDVAKIEYMECKFETEMSIKEIYYINKYKPKYNALDSYNEERYIINELENDVWEYTYDCIKNRNEKKEKIINPKNIKVNEIKYVNNYTQIPVIVKRFLDTVDGKCFIYLNNGKNNELLQMMVELGVDVSNVFITNNIKEINSIDVSYKIIVFNTSNECLISKYKKLIPHNIDLLVIRTKRVSMPNIEIVIDEKYLNRWIIKSEMTELIKQYNINGKGGKLIGLRGFKNILINSKYDVKSKSKRDGKDRYTYYFITRNGTNS